MLRNSRIAQHAADSYLMAMEIPSKEELQARYEQVSTARTHARIARETGISANSLRQFKRTGDLGYESMRRLISYLDRVSEEDEPYGCIDAYDESTLKVIGENMRATAQIVLDQSIDGKMRSQQLNTFLDYARNRIHATRRRDPERQDPNT